VTSYSTLGLTGDFHSETRQDGELVEEESETVTFDELGRVLVIIHDKAGLAGGEVIDSFSRTTTFTYDCP
jgi:hypothetical protein